MPVPGDAAPGLTLPRDGGTALTLASLRPGKVVLWFCARDDSGSCANEAQGFSDGEVCEASGVWVEKSIYGRA